MARRYCPICGRMYHEHPAISRKDNQTEICPDCGVREALEDYKKYVESARKELSHDD